MDQRQFLSLSAMVCPGATCNISAVTRVNTRDLRDFDFAFITDVHIEQGKLATSKFSRTIAEINSLKPVFVWDMGDMSLYPNSGKVYLDCIKQLQMPLHACPGNHDITLANASAHHEFKGLNTNVQFECKTSPLLVADGKIKVPTGPGLGVEIDPEFIKKHIAVKG
jgi:hypothetical protein